MRPVLFHLGSATVQSYGVCLAAAFLVAVSVILRRAERRGFDVARVRDLAFGLVIASLVGARALFVAVQPATFEGRWLHALAVWEGGMVFYGGLVGALLYAAWFARRHALSLARLGDLFAPPVALGHAIGRLGCFFAGCCYGKAVAWGVQFPPDSLAPPGARHPVQLYEAAGELALFFALSRLRPKKDGRVLAAWVLGYALLRFMLEFLRGDPERGLFAGVPTSQLLAVAAAAVALVFLRRRSADASV